MGEEGSTPLPSPARRFTWADDGGIGDTAQVGGSPLLERRKKNLGCYCVPLNYPSRRRGNFPPAREEEAKICAPLGADGFFFAIPLCKERQEVFSFSPSWSCSGAWGRKIW